MKMNKTQIQEQLYLLMDFRQKYPGVKGYGIYTNDNILTPIHQALDTLAQIFRIEFNGYKDFNFRIEVSKGQSYFPCILHISILPPKQKVSDGIYTVICFDKYGRGILAGCMESVTNPKGLNTIYRNAEQIDVNGLRSTTKYNNSFINPKEFYCNNINIDELIEHLYKSLDLTLQYLDLTNTDYEKINSLISNELDIYEPRLVDNNERIFQSIKLRRGQRAFRNELFKIYNGKCPISLCSISHILDAAHITPYTGIETNNIQNGILLRTDIHTLFDLGLLTINANTFNVIIHPSLKDTDYYNLYHNKKILLPERLEKQPSKKSLLYHNTKIFRHI